MLCFLFSCLQKGCGYHLDLFMVAVMLGVCSVMGLPWFVAATVLSITHVNSLKVESDCSAPGEQPKFLGIREQRVTGLLIFALMGCSVFFTSVLKFIPMPVLYGVFLYMGVSSLRGIQFFDRLKLFWMPAKHQPDFIYLRHVPLRKVHFFTAIQLICLVLLWTIKVSRAAIIFPLMEASSHKSCETLVCSIMWRTAKRLELQKRKGGEKEKEASELARSPGSSKSESCVSPSASHEENPAWLIPLAAQVDVSCHHFTVVALSSAVKVQDRWKRFRSGLQVQGTPTMCVYIFPKS
ncbi:electroneutral sodium bicarbonate exchanger 1-like [Morphnus guianensis]